MIFTVVLFLFFVVTLHYMILHYGKVGRALNSIPGPQALPIFGNMLSFQVSPSDLWTLVRKLGNQYYPIYKLWSFSIPYVNVLHPNDVETVLGNPRFTQKSEIYKLLLPWFSTGLLTSSGRKWQTRRKILTPSFHFNVLQQFVDIFIEEGERMIENLKSEGGPTVKDLLPFVSEHTLNVICETAMGTSLRTDTEKFPNKYRKAVHDMGLVLVYRFVRPWYFYDTIFNLCPVGRVQSKLLKILHGFTRKIIKERKEYHDETNNRYLTGLGDASFKQSYGGDEGIRKKRLAMLDLLIAAHRGNQIDDEGIREEVDTFMFRGHDTTATSLLFTIMLLAEHPKIQDRVRVEAKTVIENNGGKLNMTALQNLPYLEMCIKESLRMYPSVPFISRAPETEIKLSNYTIPAKTTVNVHIADIHRDPRFWPNPDVFDPDRFLPENCQGRHPYCYVPFSAGPRNCIGKKFAMLELKATLALLLSNFALEPVDYLKDIKMNTDLVLRPSHPVKTKLIPLEVTG